MVSGSAYGSGALAALPKWKQRDEQLQIKVDHRRWQCGATPAKLRSSTPNSPFVFTLLCLGSTQPAIKMYVTEQLHCIVYNLELTLSQWSDLLTIFSNRWHLKVLNFVCFLTFTCEGYAQDSLKKYLDSCSSSWQLDSGLCPE